MELKLFFLRKLYNFLVENEKISYLQLDLEHRVIRITLPT